MSYFMLSFLGLLRALRCVCAHGTKSDMGCSQTVARTGQLNNDPAQTTTRRNDRHPLTSTKSIQTPPNSNSPTPWNNSAIENTSHHGGIRTPSERVEEWQQIYKRFETKARGMDTQLRRSAPPPRHVARGSECLWLGSRREVGLVGCASES